MPAILEKSTGVVNIFKTYQRVYMLSQQKESEFLLNSESSGATNSILAQTDGSSINPNNRKTFDIRNFLDKLEPAEKPNKYICPVCRGNDLSVSPEDGAYQCWHGCECRDIREALAPWDNKARQPQKHKKQKKASLPAQSKTAAPIPDGDHHLAKHPEPTESPVPVTGADGTTRTKYPYGESQWTERIEQPGKDKLVVPWHMNAKGEPTNKKGDLLWQPYRMGEVRRHGAGKWVLGIEGEKCTEVARQLGLVAFTLQGSSWGKGDLVQALTAIKDAGVTGVLYYPDHDEAGYRKADGMSTAANAVGLPIVILDPLELWKQCPPKGDIADWVESGMDVEEIIKRLEQQLQLEVEARREEPATEDVLDSGSPLVEFLQKALHDLYGDTPWISLHDQLYKWVGTHYEHSPDQVEIPRIAGYCNTYLEYTEEGDPAYPYANPRSVTQALKWANYCFTVQPEKVNPTGCINVTNGIVKTTYEYGKPSHTLEPHSPDIYFTYEPLVKYDPDADPSHCERLLQCLEQPQQEVLLRTLSATLDIDTVRARRGREVRILLACGLGSNGKDALREVVSTIFGGSGMTSLSLGDFASYDEGRKFNLSGLIASRVNWSSENPQTGRLDRIQSLKLFATGNKLHSERKGRDHVEFTPRAVGIFNVNEPPALQGTMQAIQDRIAVLEFKKTFKKNPDPHNPNELLADPRFAYDAKFVQEQVAPSFLNRMLTAFVDLLENGIDYDCTEEAFTRIQKENNHLFEFCQDLNIGYLHNGEMTAKQLWSYLEQWYTHNGTITVENGGQKTWIDQVRPSDKNVRGINQVLPRIMAIFPRAERATRYDPVSKRRIPILKGIGIVPQEPKVQVIEETPLSSDITTDTGISPPVSPSTEALAIQENPPEAPQVNIAEEDALLLSDAAGQMDGEAIDYLLQIWDRERQLRAWELLPPVDRKAIKVYAPDWYAQLEPPEPAQESESDIGNLPIPETEQLTPGTLVWVYGVREQNWKPGVLKVEEDGIYPQGSWDVVLDNNRTLPAHGINQLRLRC